MTTDTDICNQALGAMGTRSTIVSLSERSAEATACALRYNALRDDMLREALWGFARGSAVLGLLRAAPGTPENTASTATQWTPLFPTPPWLYSYAYPPDCIRFRTVLTSATYAPGGYPPISPVQTYDPPGPMADRDGERFQQSVEPDTTGNQQRVINTNARQAIGCYTRRLTLPDSWDPSFQQAFIYRLAAELSIPLSGDKALAKSNYEKALQKLTSVRVDDANEGTAQQNRLPDFIAIRNGAGGWRGGACGQRI